MAGRAGRCRRPRRAAPRRPREGARPGPLHRRRAAAGDAPHGAPAQPARTRARAPDRPRRCLGGTGRPGGDRPGRGRRRRARRPTSRAMPSLRSPRRRSTRPRRRWSWSRSTGRSSSRSSTPRRRSAAARCLGGHARTSGATTSRGLAEADAVVEAEYRTQTLNHNSMETHQCVCQWRGDGIDVYISTQYIWGIRARAGASAGLPQDKVRVVCEFMGGGFGSKTGVGNYLLLAAELATRTGRPVRCALTRREENLVSGNRNATIQRVAAGAPRRRHAHRSRRRVHVRGRLERLARRRPPARRSCSTPARTSARSSTARS